MQHLLSRALKIPLPITGANELNYGITVIISGEIYQVFEFSTWRERIAYQTSLLPKKNAQDIFDSIHSYTFKKTHLKELFPVYNIPNDACFVIKHSELAKIITPPSAGNSLAASAPRMSTPLSRLFWLACRHNKDISPLIKQPYKLVSIFEQWAAEEGITDRFSGDTLKTALERGSPSSI
ncbi:hypothetical protein [Rouxiella badensis]|uniref:hypothetical protein n=1 Tax=Rouxiella badensis TaxID=1646377 RepID=UPI00301C5A46